jgi:hypothetical protein
LGRHPDSGERRGEVSGRLIVALVRETERTPVMTDRLPRTAQAEGFDGLGRVHVLVFHEPARRVGPDGQQRQPQPRMRPGHLAEGVAGAEGRVAHEVNASIRRLDHERRPQCVPPVIEPARRPVVRPVEMNDDARIQANTVTPVAALDGNGVVGAADDGIVAERHDDAGPVSAPETRERAEVHVVVVVVADEDRVDGRQVVEGDAGRGVSRRPGKHQRAGALRPDWVEEDIEAVDLDEETRMTHERGAATTFFRPRRRSVRDGGRQCARPSGGAGAKLPAEHVGQAVVLVLLPGLKKRVPSKWSLTAWQLEATLAST